MKKFENYKQSHNFQDKVKDELAVRVVSAIGIPMGVTIIAYSSFPQDSADFTTRIVSHTICMEHQTAGYVDLALRDLEEQHVKQISSEICSLLPAYKGEITLQTYSERVAEAEDCWMLTSTIQVRPFKSNVTLIT